MISIYGSCSTVALASPFATDKSEMETSNSFGFQSASPRLDVGGNDAKSKSILFPREKTICCVWENTHPGRALRINIVIMFDMSAAEQKRRQ